MNELIVNFDDSSEKVIIVGLCIIFLVNIYFIKRGLKIDNLITKIKEKKIYLILIALIIVALIAFTIDTIIQYNENIMILNETKEFEEKVNEEEAFYEQQIKENYNTELCSIPYIPNGFNHVEGDVNTGFVIEDQNGNQFVWIPCSNIDGDGFIKLKKSNFGENILFSYDECNDLEYKDFIISALRNGGYYISRYEIGKENDKPVSKKNSEIWTDITRNQAREIINSMYEDSEEYYYEIINGYGWDTAYAWILSNNNAENQNYNYEEEERAITGKVAYNNIYDLTDNMLEITLESFYGKPVFRGFLKIANQGFKEETRYTVYDEDSIRIYENEHCAIRTVLYKK